MTTSIQQRAEYPLSLHLLLTGLVLISIDIAITLLLCIIKWKDCGVLAIAWYLMISVFTAMWAVISVFYLVVVIPVWLDNKVTCDYLVAVMSLVLVSYCGVLTVAYLIVIVVVLVYDCRRWRNMKQF